MVTSTVTKNCEFVSVITCSFFYIYQNIQRNVKSESKKVKKNKKQKKTTTPENVVETIIANINVVSSNDLFIHKVVSNYYSASS